MKCPVCNIDMYLSERQGIEIDYCPQCRGIWLDRGELDKIIDRNSAPLPPQPAGFHEPYDHDEHHGQYETNGRHQGVKYHKRKGFLKDLFDF
jgi:Zn-finger nucleic acid-binding protein